MSDLFIDILTIPPTGAAAENATRELAQRFPLKKSVVPTSVPRNYRNEAKIAAWKADAVANAERDLKQYNNDIECCRELEFRRLAFDGSFGEIASIAWTVDENPLLSCCQQDSRATEEQVLHAFVDDIAKLSDAGRNVRIVAHHAAFDVRFIWQRCIIKSIAMPAWWPVDRARMREQQCVFDTMSVWSGFVKDAISLDRLCKVLGIHGKSCMKGSDVRERFMAGRFAEIRDYNDEEVRRLRYVFRRITGQKPIDMDLDVLGYAPPAAPAVPKVFANYVMPEEVA